MKTFNDRFRKTSFDEKVMRNKILILNTSGEEKKKKVCYKIV